MLEVVVIYKIQNFLSRIELVVEVRSESDLCLGRRRGQTGPIRRGRGPLKWRTKLTHGDAKCIDHRRFRSQERIALLPQ